MWLQHTIHYVGLFQEIGFVQIQLREEIRALSWSGGGSLGI